ncbi:pentatricopeptide repeat-containing protein [Tanacetum coccineum]|uniref:Pentatricopeptide repeat-containing protein n=1 Tax=Tanacetum coccineum TaxID=301880 RepID=A0ABQ4ZZ97_9ASTR
MSVDELVAWAENEANSPYLRSHPLKSKPFRKDFKGQDNLFPRSCDLENKAINDAAKILAGMNDGVEGIIQSVEGMTNGVDGLNDVDRVGHNMEMDNVEDMNDVGNGVNIDEGVLARQKKLDKGKRTMTEDGIVTIKKIKNYADMYSESDSDESDKSFNYLSNGEDKVTELRKRKFEFKNTTDEVDGQEGPTEAEQDTPNGVDKYADVDDNGIGLSPLRGEKFPTIDKFKECLTYYALANGFSLWFERSTKNKVVAKCGRRKEIFKDPSKGKHRAYKKFPSNNADKTLCNWRCYGKMLKWESTFQVVSLVDEHTCVRNFNYGKLVNYKWIGRNFTDKIRMNLQITIDAIVDLVMKKYKCIVSRTQCRNAKTFALNEGDIAIQDHYGLHRRANPRAHENLVKKEPKTWSRAFSNEAKSSAVAVPELNAMRLKGNHNYVRVYRSHRHEEDKRHEIIDGKWINNMCPNIQKILELLKDQQRLWHVIPCGGNNFEVRKGCNTFKVDEINKRCSCRVWQLSGLSCSHAIAYIFRLNKMVEGYVLACLRKDRSKKSLKTSARGGRTVIKGRMTKCAISLRATRTAEP